MISLIAASLLALAGTTPQWEIEKLETGCSATAIYNGDKNPTYLALGETLNGRFVMVLQNPAWSTVDGKEYNVYLLIDDDLYEGKATGGSSPGSLRFNLEKHVMEAIIAGRQMAPALKIDDDNERVLSALRLTGTSAAMSKVKTCLSGLTAEIERERRFPADPFKN